MAVAHHALLARLDLEIGVLCEKLSNLRFDRLGQQRTRAAAQDLCEVIAKGPWLGELDDVTVGHGVSLLHWRSGGVEHHHDTPPYQVMPSPTSRHSSGILQRARDAGVCPKVLHLDTESDLWQARSSLVVTDTGGADIAMPEEVRVYTVSGVSHAPYRPLTKPVMQLPGNQLGYGAFMRALLVALVEWVEYGIAPPDSRFPSRAAGTLVPLAAARATFPRLPQVNFPNVLNELRLRDHAVEPPIESTAYPVFVQSTDADGNALGGIRHPLLTAPLATHAGWSLRASGYGEGDLFTIQGSMIPFAVTEAERQRAGDPRPSLEARYASRDAWAVETDRSRGTVIARFLPREDEDASHADGRPIRQHRISATCGRDDLPTRLCERRLAGVREDPFLPQPGAEQ